MDTPEPESPMSSRISLASSRKKKLRFATQCAIVESPDEEHRDKYNASSVPIYQTATFKGPPGAEYDYSRSGNPTRSHLEHHLAKIYGARHAFAVSSGMAALDVITRMLKPGDEVIAGDDLYGGTNRLLSYLKSHGGVTVHHVDTTRPHLIRPLLNEKTTMVLLENPTNPLLKVADIEFICSEVKSAAPQAVIVVDNTMMSPYLQRPLELGADIVYDSGTKYLSGHHDLMAGVMACNRDDLFKQIAFVINAAGNALAPFDCFLLLRGCKTLALRMDRQQDSAMVVATYLDQLGFVTHYPGLASHAGRDIHFKNAKGAGAVLSFETGSKELSEAIIRGTRLWGISVSFGAVNSLISMPCAMSHASIPAEQRKERGLPEDLIRLCVGIEDVNDLLADLECALEDAGALQLKTGQAGEFERILPPSSSVLRSQATKKASAAVDKLEEGLAKGELSVESLGEGSLVSAPGKVILFGEHAVVHGVTAIAAAVDLRCYALTTPLPPDQLTLTFPELDGFKHTWSISNDLPWSSASSKPSADPHVLDESLLKALEASDRTIPSALRGIEGATTRRRNAALCFLYLYMILSNSAGKRPSVEFTTRSTLPLGAGMGSSASYSTCVAASFLLQIGKLKASQLNASSSELVNTWAFVGEKILHGNPSGVDNSVAVYGSGMAFTRSGFGRPGGMEGVKGFKSISLLVTDTKVGRNTKELVAGVGALKEKEPERVGALLKSIQAISDRAKSALSDNGLSRPRLLEILNGCVDENHQHLVALGVSHPSLERIREITAQKPYGLSTKLTGAGGGGCAVTLLPDNFESDKLAALQNELKRAGFQPYLTSVGGPGFGIFDVEAYQQPQEAPPLSPSSSATPAKKMRPLQDISALRDVFERQSTQNVPAFGAHEGKWLHA